MFTTRNESRHLHSRPMTTLNKHLDEDDALWFFMSRKDSPFVELTAQPEVNVNYVHPGEESYVSITGWASVVNDPAKIHSLWSRMADVWFPGGESDPDLALVEVQITHAQYWHVDDNKVTQLYRMAKALVSGTRPIDLGKTGKIENNLH